MKNETYVKVTAGIFGLVAVMHLYRLLAGDITITFGNFVLPQGVSLLGLAAAGYLAYAGYRLKK